MSNSKKKLLNFINLLIKVSLVILIGNALVFIVLHFGYHKLVINAFASPKEIKKVKSEIQPGWVKLDKGCEGPFLDYYLEANKDTLEFDVSGMQGLVDVTGITKNISCDTLTGYSFKLKSDHQLFRDSLGFVHLTDSQGKVLCKKQFRWIKYDDRRGMNCYLRFLEIEHLNVIDHFSTKHATKLYL